MFVSRPFEATAEGLHSLEEDVFSLFTAKGWPSQGRRFLQELPMTAFESSTSKLSSIFADLKAEVLRPPISPHTGFHDLLSARDPRTLRLGHSCIRRAFRGFFFLKSFRNSPSSVGLFGLLSLSPPRIRGGPGYSPALISVFVGNSFPAFLFPS